MTRRLFLLGFALMAWPHLQGSAAAPISEELAFTYIYACGGAGGYEGWGPMCATPVLAEVSDITRQIPLPAPGSWSPDGRQLLIVRDDDIYVAPATGTPLVNLTNHAAYDGTPSWSPDGSRIAFASDRDGALDLYLMNADGSGVVRLHTGVARAVHPTWSPDSTRLAFTCFSTASAPAGTGDICTIAADGSGLAWLTTDAEGDADPAWSPDGTRIVFSTTRFGEQDLAVMNPDGTGLTPLGFFGAAVRPSWSSDGSRIAFVTSEFLPYDPWFITYVNVVNADGTNFVTLALGDNPAWRPWTGEINARPVASLTVQCAAQVCTFDASPSSDSDGSVVSYGWYFPDGTTQAGQSVTHEFAAAGQSYPVRLVVMDDKGGLGTGGTMVDFNQPPVVSFTTTCNDLTCTVDASASFDPDGTIQYVEWSFGDALYGSYGSGSRTSHTYAAPGRYTVTVTVTDSGWKTRSYSQTIEVLTAMHVGDLDGAGTATTGTWSATVAIAVHTSNHRALANARVSGLWNDGTTGLCTTGTDGRCTVSKNRIRKAMTSVSFNVINVELGACAYASGENHDPDGDSNGRLVVVAPK